MRGSEREVHYFQQAQEQQWEGDGAAATKKSWKSLEVQVLWVLLG